MKLSSPEKNDLCVVIASSGTGGHIYPSLAIAEALKEKFNAQVIFIGTKHRMERSIIPSKGFPLKTISIQGIERKFNLRAMLKNFLTFIKLLSLVPLMQSLLILKKARPCVVIGAGGYVSGPVILAAWLLRLPRMILEFEVVPGLTNKILSRFVHAAMITYEDSKKYYRPSVKTVLTGIPLRKEILEGDKEIAKEIFGLKGGRFTILISGGSLGSLLINQSVLDAVKILIKEKGLPPLQILHSVGKRFYDENKYPFMENQNLLYRPVEYIEQMGDALALADLIVCRAGASTLAEVAAVGIPAILIPWSGAAEKHQERNAEFFKKKGAAEVIYDRELTGENLARTIISLIKDRNKLAEMAFRAKNLAKLNAAQMIVEQVLTLCGKNSTRADG